MRAAKQLAVLHVVFWYLPGYYYGTAVCVSGFILEYSENYYYGTAVATRSSIYSTRSRSTSSRDPYQLRVHLYKYMYRYPDSDTGVPVYL